MHFSVLVIGGGQAGLSASYLLKERGIDHLVFEKNRLAESWRSKRWDTFCLVTPNWQCQLPGHPYSGPDPHGFMVKDEIVAYIESYAHSFQPPIHEGVTVSRLQRNDAEAFEVTTEIGIFTADQVIVATGGYQDATIPRMAERISARSIRFIHPTIKMPNCCRPAKCWWSAQVNPVAKSPRTCILRDGVSISASAAPRAPRGAIAAKMWSIG